MHFMTPLWEIITLVLLCTLFCGIAGATPSPDQNGTSLSDAVSESSEEHSMDDPILLNEQLPDLKDFVKEGVAFAKNNSKEESLARFNDAEGKFVQGERYLFAYDVNGTTLALPYEQNLIGTNRMDLIDSNGMEFIRALRYLAGYGGGYLYYVYPNPAEEGIEQVKIAYVEPVDDTWFVGSGFYLPDIPAVMDPQAVSDLMARVEKGAAFGEKEGKEKASLVFNDRNDTWAKDNTYIFAYDLNGTVLAMPYQPESIGTSRWNYTDTYGSPIARLDIDIAKAGGGFMYVMYYNPASGKDELKFCYILPVNPDWLVGSGIYLQEHPVKKLSE